MKLGGTVDKHGKLTSTEYKPGKLPVHLIACMDFRDKNPASTLPNEGGFMRKVRRSDAMSFL
jgi:hypothetical protein